MSTDDENLVGRLLKQSILTMCREAVQYRSTLEIDGLICISSDNERQVVIKIHELFHKLPRQLVLPTRITNQDYNQRITQETKKPNLNYPSPANPQINYVLDDVRLNDSDSMAEDDDTGASSPSYDNNRLPDNIDKEMHTLAIYKVYKDSKALEMKNKDADRIGESAKTNTNNKTAATSINSVRMNDAVGTPSSDHLAQNFGNSKDIEKYPNLQPSTLQNIHCKRCNQNLEDGTAFQQHNADIHSLYTCFVCLSTFTSRNNMNRHIRIHSGTKPYSCPRCPERFTRKDDVKRHLLRHDFDKPFRCALCSRGYTEKLGMHAHLEKEHGCNEFHSCSSCGKCYGDFDEFQLHKKSHPEFKNFGCTLCNFTGSNSMMYFKHLLIHDYDKKYTCIHCNNGTDFKDPLLYTAHLKKHRSDPRVTAFQCCFCETILTSYDLFVRHEYSHIQDKKHECKVCEKTFECLTYLKKHMSVHDRKPSSEKSETELQDRQMNEMVEKNYGAVADLKASVDYWCAECNQGFPTEHQLEDHILETHEQAENLSTHKEQGTLDNSENLLNQNSDSQKLLGLGRAETLSIEGTEKLLNNPHNNAPSSGNSLCKGDRYMKDILEKEESFSRDTVKTQDEGNIPSMSLLRSDSHLNQETATELSPRLKLPKLYNLIFGQNAVQMENKGVKTEIVDSDYRDADQNNVAEDFPKIKRIKTEKEDDDKLYIPIQNGTLMTNESPLNLSTNQKDHITPSYSNSSILGMNTEFSFVDSAPSSVKMKVRTPGFEKVITPEVLFRTKAPFTCEDCNEMFGDFSSFDQHGISVHHSFICDYCGKVFTAKPNRERHVRYHTGEKPYSCELCDESFFRGDDLKYHRTAKHGDVRPYVCNGCPRTFVWRKDFDKHVRRYPDHR